MAIHPNSGVEFNDKDPDGYPVDDGTPKRSAISIDDAIDSALNRIRLSAEVVDQLLKVNEKMAKTLHELAKLLEQR